MDKNSFYQPTGQKIPGVNATYVPDLYRQVAEEMRAEESGMSPKDSSQNNTLVLQKRPIIGVLYSISACLEGELFPIYVGRNIIGSDLSCDICLRETSVSPLHGLLLARKQIDQNGEEYINVILSDNNSRYGTMVNGEKLSFEKVECSDGDVITIGQNYVLILSLFNAINKLKVSYGFDRMPDDIPADMADESEEPADMVPGEQIMPQQEEAMAGLEEHSTHTTKDPNEEAPESLDFYKPTKQKGQDHYNNETIIL